MKPLVLIPARGGSKGIPRKNLRPFLGRPLIAWAIEVGKQLSEDGAFVSTEDKEIAMVALRYGADIMYRPAELAADETPMLDVVKEAIEHGDWDTVVLLQPTQPLRTVGHVWVAMKLLTEGWDSVATVVRIPDHYSPDFAMTLIDGRLEPICIPMPTRRQDCRPAFSRDGTAYVIRRETIEAGSLYGKRCLGVVIPDGESCNIDTEADWLLAERMAQKAVA